MAAATEGSRVRLTIGPHAERTGRIVSERRSTLQVQLDGASDDEPDVIVLRTAAKLLETTGGKGGGDGNDAVGAVREVDSVGGPGKGHPVGLDGPVVVPTNFWRNLDLVFMCFMVVVTVFGLFGLPYVADDNGEMHWSALGDAVRRGASRTLELEPAECCGLLAGAAAAVFVVRGIATAASRPGVCEPDGDVNGRPKAE